MKKIVIILLSIFAIFSFTSNVNASIFSNWNTEIPYCSWDDCWFWKWVSEIEKADIDWVVKNTTASAYIQRILVYLLGFLRLAAIILVIYAGFNMLTAAWDEDKFNKSKTMLIYSMIWLVIIFAAWPITNFIIDIFVKNA